MQQSKTRKIHICALSIEIIEALVYCSPCLLQPWPIVALALLEPCIYCSSSIMGALALVEPWSNRSPGLTLS